MGDGDGPDLPGAGPPQNRGRLGNGGPGRDHIVDKPEGEAGHRGRVGAAKCAPNIFPAGGGAQAHLGRRRPNPGQTAGQVPDPGEGPEFGAEQGRLVVTSAPLPARVKGYGYDRIGPGHGGQGPVDQQGGQGSGQGPAVAVFKGPDRRRQRTGVEAGHRLAGQRRTGPAGRMGAAAG